MNTPRPLLLTVTIFGSILSVSAAASTSPTPAKPKAPQAQAPLITTNTIPQSVFTFPKDPKEGRDPFFPDSVRFSNNSATTNAQPANAPDTAALMFQGMSGSSENRLAIINGRTLAEGEETDVTIGTGRVHFRCIQINPESVVIEVGNTRRELRLKSN
ncbi:MAG: hypothetical protein ACTHLW_15095 [Verrucomicrobiota bacterium]